VSEHQNGRVVKRLLPTDATAEEISDFVAAVKGEGQVTPAAVDADAERAPRIICHGDDGQTTFRYYELADADTPSGYVGWLSVLERDGSTTPTYATPLDVAGDLESMNVLDAASRSILEAGTQSMLDELRSRGDADADGSVTRQQIALLSYELAVLTDGERGEWRHADMDARIVDLRHLVDAYVRLSGVDGERVAHGTGGRSRRRRPHG